ncbi:MAG: ketoacyl-ACP synthase III [Spirochaetaceae bacterium]|nr:ketoacyl-ACP synthase III [Spirochaetaceae bacterium]
MTSSLDGVVLEAVAACVPKTIVRNAEFGRELYGDKLDSLIGSTGMIERRVCGSERVTSLDLCVKAAKAAFETARVSPADIGTTVFVTLTPDAIMPNNATAAQAALELPGTTAAFDVNHACTGYIYGLWVASCLARTTGKRVLLLDGDTNSYYVSPRDKSTSILFGDAGTATIIAPAPGVSPWTFDFRTDGTGRRFIQVPGFGFREGITEKSLEYLSYEDGSSRRRIDMEMDGAAVFTYVVNTVSGFIASFMDELETTPEEYSHLVLHQANAFMLRQLGRKLGFKPTQIPMSMGKFGNTSSASIPLNICSELAAPFADSSPRRVLLSGFGAGLSYGAVDLSVSGVKSPGIIEY